MAMFVSPAKRRFAEKALFDYPFGGKLSKLSEECNRGHTYFMIV